MNIPAHEAEMEIIVQHLDVSLSVLIIGILVTYIAATIQATIGFGFAMTCVPILSLIDHQLTPVPQLFALAPLTIGMAWRERHQADLRGVVWVLLGRVMGAGIGVYCLTIASSSVLNMLIGSMVLIAVLLVWQKPNFERTKTTEVTAGTMSGISALISSIGGPMLALLYRNESGGTLRASMASIFVVGLLITFIARFTSGHITIQDAIIGICFMPPALLGLRTSSSFLSVVEGPFLRWAILIIAGSASIILICKGAFA